MAFIISERLKLLGWNDKNIVSLGCGKGILEYHLRKMNSGRKIVCTDYTGKAIERLNSIYSSSNDVNEVFDMLEGDYSNYKDCILVSTEFSPEQWNRVIEKMIQGGIERVVFVPTEFATLKQIIYENFQHLKRKTLGKRDTFCGYLYTERELRNILTGNMQNKFQLRTGIVYYNNTGIMFLERDR